MSIGAVISRGGVTLPPAGGEHDSVLVQHVSRDSSYD